ncbi:hypothetical protein ROZALSC1DRAFT_30552 [Rozella allomycis CSF55]|uniref:Uncharacterized protein n=1 Tax=Rozella allomycis (strain CSF55) TaxID=988480 RepID=A0A075ARX1_ROZAC|nr:hypothetical protein O9G_002843 [Rozella allomycis CSF55]RKP17680.1 hypothetical protein ROZALSC1DRAFT_30552 [Rozella allomycis CSF55]|eukprot:EPZ32925.1 hypothetical protein O9G_002843 [Rozella allomycis CSF55]
MYEHVKLYRVNTNRLPTCLGHCHSNKKHVRLLITGEWVCLYPVQNVITMSGPGDNTLVNSTHCKTAIYSFHELRQATARRVDITNGLDVRHDI